ncbi:MAG: TerC/Alx family metal homeostasis membrane protein [Phycisphaerales bacterium]|nr:TerC/Alx family metal homeostasis membrane protein [Phycisphaerales bacterium]
MNSQHLIALGIFLAFVVAMLALDLFVLHRRPHEIKMKEALLGAILPVILALAFMVAVYWAYERHFLGLGVLTGTEKAAAKYYATNGWDASLLFFTGYLVELSMSADNVFLFVVLMNFFEVPRELRHRVLFWGVIGALVMRGIMIAAGVALLTQFEWIVYVFGAFLIAVGVKMLFSARRSGEVSDPGKSWAVRVLRNMLPIKPGYDGKRFFTRDDKVGGGGVLMGTSLLLVLVCIEVTDLIFALDSISAIFGITRDGFLIFTSNVFAVIGLRSMCFLLADAVDRFDYLKPGLAAILGFVGVKMVLPALAAVYGHLMGTPPPQWDITVYVSLSVIAGVLVVAVAMSLIFPRRAAGKPAG